MVELRKGNATLILHSMEASKTSMPESKWTGEVLSLNAEQYFNSALTKSKKHSHVSKISPEQEDTGVKNLDCDNRHETWSPLSIDDYNKRFGKKRQPLSEEFLVAMKDPRKVLEMGKKLGLTQPSTEEK